MADYWELLRGNLEGLIAKVKAGKYSLETALLYLNKQYKYGHSRGGWVMNMPDPTGERKKELGHYLRALLDAQASRKGSKSQELIRSMGSKGIVPSNIAAHYAEKVDRVGPIFVPPSVPQFIAPQARPTPQIKRINESIEQLRQPSPEKPYATVVREIMQAGIAIGPEMQSALVDEAGMAAGFSPQYIAEHSLPTSTSIKAAVKGPLGMPQWLFEHTWVPYWRNVRGYPEDQIPEYVTAENTIEMVHDLQEGKWPEVPDYIGDRLEKLPEDASFTQKAGAVTTGLLTSVAHDPICLFSLVGGFRGAVGSVAKAVTARTEGRFAAYAAKHYSELRGLATVMKDTSLKILEDRMFDVEMFTKGHGVQAIKEAFRQAAKTQGLTDDAAKWVASQWTRIWQGGLKKQVRILGREFGSAKDLVDMDAVVRAKAADALAKATARAHQMMGTKAAEAKLAEIAGLPAATAYEQKVADMAAEQIVKMTNERSLGKLTDWASDFFVRTGNSPAVFNAPLGAMGQRFHTTVSRYSDKLTKPLRHLNENQRRRVLELMGLHNRVVTSEKFSKLSGIPVGEVWSVPMADRVETALKMTGEWAGSEQAAKMVDEGIVIVDKLPKETKRLWTATDEMVKGFIGVREEVIERLGVDIGDKGAGYLTYLPASPEYNRLTQSAAPAAKQWFMNNSEYEHPLIVEWLRAAGHTNIPKAITDPQTLSVAYAHGIAKAGLNREVGTFYKKYGIKGLDPDIAELIGYSPPVRTIEAEYLASIGKPSPLMGLEDYYLPVGTGNYITAQMAPTKAERALQPIAAKWLAPTRLDALNTVRFPMINLPEQPFSAIMAGVQGIKDPDVWRAAFRASLEAMMESTLEIGRASTPQGWMERLKLGAFRGGLGLADSVDDKLFKPLRNNVLADGIRNFLKIQKLDDDVVEETVQWLLNRGTMGEGVAGTLRQHMDSFSGIADVVLRNTLGWGIRTAAMIEDFARGAADAVMHIHGIGDADATRRLTAGFVPYGKAWKSHFDGWASMPSFFFQYAKTRPGRVLNAVIERPWLAALPYRMARAAQDAMFDDEEQIMFRGQERYIQATPSFMNVTWDTPPFSSIALDEVPQDIRDQVTPVLQVPFSGVFDVAGDIAGRLGLSSERSLSLVNSLVQSLHPGLKSTGLAWQGKLWEATQMALPIVKRVTTAVKLADKPDPADILKLYDRYRIQLGDQQPVPRVTEALWNMYRFENRTRETTGIITKFSSHEGMMNNMSFENKDLLNLHRETGLGLGPRSYSAKQAREVSERAAAVGHPTMTQLELNEQLWNDGIAAGDWLKNIEAQSEQAHADQLGLDGWRKENERRRSVDEEYLPITALALEEFNRQRIEASETKFPPLSPANALDLETRPPVPITLGPISRFARGDVPLEVDMCAKAQTFSYFGRSGLGDAEDLPALWDEHGFTTLPAGSTIRDAQPGDAVWIDTGSEHGHTGWWTISPDTGEPALQCSRDEKVTYEPIDEAARVIISRPPKMNALEYEMEQLR